MMRFDSHQHLNRLNLLLQIYTISTKQTQNDCAASVNLQKLMKKVFKSQQKLVAIDGWISNTLQGKMP